MTGQQHALHAPIVPFALQKWVSTYTCLSPQLVSPSLAMACAIWPDGNPREQETLAQFSMAVFALDDALDVRGDEAVAQALPHYTAIPHMHYAGNIWTGSDSAHSLGRIWRDCFLALAEVSQACLRLYDWVAQGFERLLTAIGVEYTWQKDYRTGTALPDYTTYIAVSTQTISAPFFAMLLRLFLAGPDIVPDPHFTERLLISLGTCLRLANDKRTVGREAGEHIPISAALWRSWGWTEDTIHKELDQRIAQAERTLAETVANSSPGDRTWAEACQRIAQITLAVYAQRDVRDTIKASLYEEATK